MTSINTNVAAQTALRTLQSTNAQLDATQSRISTGLKIGSAKDNAAYWSISTAMKSDNKALATVKDALALGSGAVDVAYQGLNSSLNVLNEIKSKLTAASNPSADRAAIQAELTQLFDQLTAFADAASFGGENWLAGAAVSGSGGSGSSRTNPQLTAIKTVIDGATETPGGANTKGTAAFTFGSDATFISGDTLTISVTVGSTSAQTVEIDFADLASTNGVLNAATLRSTLAAAVSGNSLTGVTIDGSGSNFTITTANDNEAVTISAVVNVAAAPSGGGSSGSGASTEKNIVTGFTRDGNAVTLKSIEIDTTDFNLATLTTGVEDIAISATTTAAEFEGFLDTVQAAIKEVTDAAAKLGAVSSRIEMQQSFVDTLRDTIDKGISGLVDADMNEESTRLQALQVKQQLGVQALSIANQSAQNVLRLFQ